MSDTKTALDGLRIEREQDFEPRRRWGRILVWLVLLAAAAGGAWWFLNRPVPVRTVAARAADVSGPRTLLNASGYVTARREATVSSKITGKVMEVFLEEGQRVEQGQVLARLDDSNVKAGLAYAEALLAASKSSLVEIQVRLEEAVREFRRVETLLAGKIATESDLDRAQAEVKSLEARLGRQAADVTVAERELGVRRQELEDMVIRAPFAGVVTIKNAQPGEMISPISAGGGFTRTGICTLVDMTSLEIEVDVGESYLNRVTSGQVVEAALDAYPDWKIPCKVIAIIPTADRQKSTVKVRIGFDQLDPRILPDMAVRVAFRGTGEAAPGEAGVVVPKAAVLTENGRDTAWVVKDGQAARKTLTVVPGKDGQVTVTKGLQVDDRVVVDGAATLREGARVSELQP
jgi:RND family efflux transporter MFP subunit